MVCCEISRAERPAPAAELRDRRQLSLRLGSGAYSLPRDVAERLSAALAGYRNRDAALALAVFLARFWSSRARLARPFPVDRRALADHVELGLTEGRVRGAIRVLEEVGFLNRGEPAPGSAYRQAGEGLQRKPILFGFGAEYGPLFAAANARATRARQRAEGRRREISSAAARPSSSSPNLPKDTNQASSVVLMGKRGNSADWQSPARRSEPRPFPAGASHRPPRPIVTAERPTSPTAFDERLAEIMRRVGFDPGKR